MYYYESDGGDFPNGKGGWTRFPRTHYLVKDDLSERIDCNNKKEAMALMRELNKWELAFKKGLLTEDERKELASYNQELGIAEGQCRDGMTEEKARAILDKIQEGHK